MTQIVGENLGRRHLGRGTQGLHGTPDARAIHGEASPRDENASLFDSLLFNIGQELFAKLRNDENAPCFALAIDPSLSTFDSRYRDIRQLADTDPRTADGLQDEGQAVVSASLGGGHEPHIFLPR